MTTRFEITNQEIQTAFLNVLNSTDFSKLTINQICDEAGISRITFYRHYADKYDLLSTINTTQINTLKKYIQNRLHQKDISNALLQMTEFLEHDATTMNRLLEIKHINHQASLEYKLKNLLYDEFYDYMLHELQTDIIKGMPVAYFSELYAANATIFIKYSLDKGPNPQLITSLNQLQKFVFEFLKSD
ncbi:TetR/AcrR family transcriptional regulator [Leuconostoc falkenbergense]|uniref:TetR/AcrR family transcriptional regulator n=1 Tax=Leuconostoc falkenbergense TaxID=2766470 RepID=UPI00027385F6|nr:TetR/AcrR family transcriptional regulator [Leuconostoc falkenbergense]KDA48093.1 Transcriptional regulator, TetR family [Leuconostoc pseudomesenteroides 1159]OQJ67571.1 TetR family transcriptional regulator [Leuconostoc pseudomesenteroides]CCJ66750.1 Transcriptional regulator, TetR family [Leuconostoc pseudomesenteroides 4882]OQJ79404.1 TetR family transcriptional regulator [Leuconostoc pseudomesenteroides]OQJ81331.1 TetR family transcriptional regulator [Leuconostoc pseudomesenteroides]